MKVVPVRRLLAFQPQDFIYRLKSTITVKYDDGTEVRHTPNELVVNRYVLSVLEEFPTLPIKHTYSVTEHYVAGHYVASTINQAFSCMLEDIVDTFEGHNWNRGVLTSVYAKMLNILEAVYNNVVCDNLEHISSLRITDFLDIQLQPELMDAIQQVKVKRDLASVEHTYDVLDTVIRTTPELAGNPVAKGYIAGTIASNQVKQLLASRGFVTEIDGGIFKYPIANGFVLGLENMYDMAVESRSGAKALYLSSRTIALAEYFAREMQLVTMAITNLVDGDCGNTDTLEWCVTEKDLKNLIGKHYIYGVESGYLTMQHTHLIGKVVQIRNLSRCKLDNYSHVCTACFGKLSSNVHLHTGLGHWALTVLTAIISQLILSTKHVTKSAGSDSVVLDNAAKEYFIIKNKDTYVFRANSITKKRYKYAIHINQEQGCGVPGIATSADIYKLNLDRVSDITNLVLSKTDQDGKAEYTPMIINQGSRNGRFSYEFLGHIRKTGYELDAYDRITISLEDWGTGVPFITLPQVEFSYMDLANAIKNEFKYMRADPGTPEAFLHKIYNIVNSKLSINLALLEVIVLAFVCKDPDNGDFRPGRCCPNAKPAKIGSILTTRSVGGAYAWERCAKTLISPSVYYGNNAVDHPLDALLDPVGTLANQHL